MSEPEKTVYRSELATEIRKCHSCRAEFSVCVLHVNTSKITQQYCDACVDAEDMRGLNSDKHDRRAWHISQGWIDANTLAHRFDLSEPRKENENYQWARQWKPDSGGNVYIWGPKGTGKTFLAQCLLNAAFDAGKMIAEVNAIEYVSLYEENRVRGIKHFRNPHVLLFDDVDKAAWTVFTFQQLYGLLEYRAKRNLRTIMTANAELRSFLNEHLVKYISNKALLTAAFDRMQPVTVLETQGDSLRKPRPFVYGVDDRDNEEDLLGGIPA